MNKIAFLNGGSGYGSVIEEELAERLALANFQTILIDNLFDRPAKLKYLKGYDTLVFGTSGVRPEDVAKLVDHFRTFVEVTGYEPKNVVFTMDEANFVPLTKEFPNTKFFRLDYLDFTFIPLKYLNEDRTLNTIVSDENGSHEERKDTSGNSNLA